MAMRFFLFVTLLTASEVLKFSEAGIIGDIGNIIKGIVNFIVTSVEQIATNIFNPPKSNNDSIQYLLYTPDSPDEPCHLEPRQEALEKCPFNPSYPLKMLIHGFLVTLGPQNRFFKIKTRMLELYDYNVIIVNYTSYNQPPYILAAFNTQIIGNQVAHLIKFLEKYKGVDPKNMHLIGFSLGAQIAGQAGKNIPNLARITGLDPAAPLFSFPINVFHTLNNTDADFVDVIHTSTFKYGYGMHVPVGDIDFYPNGGVLQPRCVKNSSSISPLSASLRSCNHNSAPLYFYISLNTSKCLFWSINCDSYSDFVDGKCSSNTSATALMGLPAEMIPGLPPQSKFYLRTSERPPYCLK
ncbi:pancreatic triacylglycerol lipase [Caerostris darwini]|uniref:Pancreatic triacylglycerol lipase n=1 Tax=Caerostris darwini TaxID=1538125 RepID=A0AAV4N7Z3_9ARAC|nr:pancreatic triacylglycerol lipase [Caerostris darwini]